MEFLTLLIGALIVEAVWETSKMVWQNGKLCIDKVGALVVSLIVCFGAKLDLLTLVGLGANPYISIILTGILLSRGSSFLHELIEKINGLNKQ